jgi:hypothetical protein
MNILDAKIFSSVKVDGLNFSIKIFLTCDVIDRTFSC